MLGSKIPKWVKNFPYDLDREALLSLARQSKGAFDAPREMNFVLFGFDSLDAAKHAADHCSEEGWACSFQHQEDDKDKFLLIATKQGYVLAEGTYTEDIAFFQRIASLFTVGYDGWFASN